ncbi:hypothetical protein DPMN_087867 [Dreissena polymorpha]|uniref:Uncharacterized protein n=1 Tax=Dreissena polymorpha TaxID=45954 RepID=A0A9D4KTG6_DREPO|nr:hypothetical protein DPMN_087867 [Dreissena polymorpha]
MAECDHEEADTRIVLHLKDAIERGAKICQIRTVDGDVVVILVGILHRLKQISSDCQYWVSFGKDNHFCFYDINQSVSELGEDTAVAILMVHALSGCDTFKDLQ